MKSASRLLILVLACCAPAASGYAQSPREQLNEMVQHLQKTPNDNALRERILKLGASIRPAPAIPEEARRPFVRAATALKHAKTEPEYARAIVLYREALAIAPWWGDAYYNLAKAQELRGDFREAMESLKFFILAAPPAADARQAQDQIYALEERLVRKTAEANSPEARAAKQKIKDDDLLKSLEGAVFSHSYTNVERQFRISNGRAEVRDRRITSGSPLCSDGAQRSGPIGEQMTCPNLAVRFTGRHGQRSHHFGIDSFEIAEDRRTLLVKHVFDGKVTNIVFRRQ